MTSRTLGTGIGFALTFALVLVVSFLFTAGLVKVACWAFGYAFTWKLALGVWVVLAIVRQADGGSRS